MASRIHKRIALRRKLQVLKTLTKSKSVKKSCIIRDAFICINKMKLQLEAIRTEYLYLLHHIQEVRVEKVGKGFVVKMRCKRGEEILVKILEALEEKGLNVVHASVTCNYLFCMEAIVEPHDDEDQQEAMDVIKDLTQALVNAIHKESTCCVN